jgi:transcription antitermination factor NusG
MLATKDMQCFAPGWDELKTYSDRKLLVKKPAFPGYLFCRFAEAERIYVLNTPGVRGILGTGRVPEPIEDETIISLQSVFQSPQKVTPTSYLVVGDPVRVVRGPIAGAEGILIRTKSIDRLVISVHLLQRSVSVEIQSNSVVPLRRHTSVVPSVYGYARLA